MTRAFSSEAETGSRQEKASKGPRRLAHTATGICLLLLASAAADTRPLEKIIERGALTLCANANALPFASKTGPVSGFQIELGEKIAQQLGVKLTREWVISAIQYRRADCDLVLDAIIRSDAPSERGIKVSRPYQRSGVVLAVRADSQAASLAGLGSDQRVGVPVGSLVSMTLDKGGVATSPFHYEDDIVAALANREIEAAAVTPATVGWFNQQHADKKLRLIPAFENDADLNWNIAAGLIRPDDRLRARVDAAIEALLADGTIARIYARYGIELRSPQ